MDIFLRDEDVAILNLYREKWNHPSIEWSGEYRADKTETEAEKRVRLVITVSGPTTADGKRYQANMYHSPRDWDMCGEAAVRSLCYYYPELITTYFPGFEGYFVK